MRMEENLGEYFDVALMTFEKGSVEMEKMRPERERGLGRGWDWLGEEDSKRGWKGIG